MIDTVTIRLNEWQFRIVDHNKFSPNSQGMFIPPYTRMGGRAYIDSVQNPTRRELLNGNYKPQLTLRKRWQNGQPLVFLYIQFSAPKLLFGNNFDELTDSDFDLVIDKLQTKLLEMGVSTNIPELRNAVCSKVHFGKNIILTNYAIPYMLIKEIKKTDFDLRYDIAEKDYRNEGHSIRFHSKDFEIIFYDKKKDLLKAKIGDSKAIEQDNAIQLGLFDEIKTENPFEVLRMETRLNTLRRIQQELGVGNHKVTFEEIFKEKLAFKVLNKYWRIIFDNYELMSYQIENKEKFLANFIINNPKARLGNAFQTYAFLEYVKEIGIRRFRKIIEDRYSQRTWYSLKSGIKKYKMNKVLSQPMFELDKQFHNFEPVKLKDYKILS